MEKSKLESINRPPVEPAMLLYSSSPSGKSSKQLKESLGRKKCTHTSEFFAFEIIPSRRRFREDVSPFGGASVSTITCDPGSRVRP